MKKLEGQIFVARIGGKWGLKGFTRKDMYTLGRIARKRYKLKTRRKRILKKYIVKLLNDALRSAEAVKMFFEGA